MVAQGWSILDTFPTGFEADFVIAQLEANDIPALRDNHDSSALFGVGFQGATSKGYTVMVPTEALAEARALLAEVEEQSVDDDDDE